MADVPTPDQAVVKRRRGKPWGYLVLSALVLGVFLTAVLRPDLTRGLLGGDPPRPGSPGDSPAVAGDVAGGALGDREAAAALADLGTVNLAKPPPLPAAPDIAGPVAGPVAGPTDEAKAAGLLAEAEAAYKAMDWDKAESLARGLAKSPARSPTRNRAADLERGAQALKRVFRELDERDELTRNFETHPSLIRLVRAGSETLAVPITQMDSPYNPVIDNPIEWVEAQRKAGKVMLLVKGARQFTPAEMAVDGYDLLPADLAAARAAALQTLSSRATRIESDKSVRRDAFVWYELGKFAFRHRLDDQVVRYLDRAIELDPDLARNVREANAGILFGSLIMHSRNGNTKQAAAFMASIERRYKDTDQAKQARLFYDGKQSEMVAAAKDSERRQREEAASRLAAKVAAAKKQGDEAKAKAIVVAATEDEPEAPPVEQAAETGPVDALVASARSLRDNGRNLLGEATNMPATEERNHKYAQAAKLLAQAKALYIKYLSRNASDSSAEAEMVETNKMWFTANKMKTL
jgi:hypothetical protein